MNKRTMLNNTTVRFGILVAFLGLCWFGGAFVTIDFYAYKVFLSRFPLGVSGALFVGLYVVVTFFAWLAKDVFKVLGAILFGAYISTLFIWIAEIVNVIVRFHVSRSLGRGFVERKLAGQPARLDAYITESGFWGIFALRIVPLVPFRFLDFAAGLTSISFKKYLLISIVGSPVRIFWIQFVLAGIGEQVLARPVMSEILPALTDYMTGNSLVFAWSFLYLIAAIVLLIRVRKTKKVAGR